MTVVDRVQLVIDGLFSSSSSSSSFYFIFYFFKKQLVMDFESSYAKNQQKENER
jgi:hypothetical protein